MVKEGVELKSETSKTTTQKGTDASMNGEENSHTRQTSAKPGGKELAQREPRPCHARAAHTEKKTSNTEPPSAC